MVEATEFSIKLRKLLMARQAQMPATSLNVTTASVEPTKPNRLTLTPISGSLGETNWDKCLYATGSNSGAYPSIRVIDTRTAGTFDLVGEPTIGPLAAADTGVLFAGPLRTAHIAVTQFSHEAYRHHFLESGVEDPLAVLLKWEDFNSSLVNFSGVQQRGEFRMTANLVMLANDDVAVRNTLLLGCAVQQFMLFIDEVVKGDQRTKARFHTVGEVEAARLTYSADLFQTSSEPLERQPVLVASLEFPMNFM